MGIRAEREPPSICPLRVDLDGDWCSSGVVAEAAPGVVFRPCNESSCDGVTVDVLDLLNELGGGKGVEVVVSGLPELFAAALEEFRGFAFDDAAERGEGACLWFAGQKVDVLWHQDISVDAEFVGEAGSLNDPFEGVFRLGVFEAEETAVAAEGDEVELACVLSTFEAVWHEESLSGSRIRANAPLMR